LTPVEQLVRERIAREGPLSFCAVMDTALYHPRLGYYSNLRGFGAAGDFITSPEVHPIFGQLLSRQAIDVWEHLGRPRPFRVLEIGAGSGSLARALLTNVPEVSYGIDELSPALRRVQQARLAGLRVTWDEFESPHLVIANEVLDALPVHLVTVRDGVLRERLVGADLQWVETDARPELHAYFARLGLLPPEGAVTEVNLGLEPWVRRLAGRLTRGLALILDYGYPAEAFFARPQGTLLTYYQHTIGSDPLVRLGLQDISVNVDFTTLASAANAAGLKVIGITSQRALLRNLGIGSLAPALVDPAGLGRIGALFLGRGLDEDYVPAGLKQA
jgi:SAM-dependent MidA family methyltransferase